MFSKFFPKDFNFFEIFDKEVGTIEEAAHLFKKIVHYGEVTPEFRERMRDVEHAGDKIAYSIIEQLNKSFITPFDREDIHSLAKKLDDVIDQLDSIVSRMKVYKIKKPNKSLMEFSIIIDNSIMALATAVRGLRDSKHYDKVINACKEINKYESEGDKLRDSALSELVDNEKDPIEFIKWKELCQYSETVLDICKDCAHVIETILVKQA
jgi:predicted phosphate transport protein (TIGR00153 family)